MPQITYTTKKKMSLYSVTTGVLNQKNIYLKVNYFILSTKKKNMKGMQQMAFDLFFIKKLKHFFSPRKLILKVAPFYMSDTLIHFICHKINKNIFKH